MTEPTRPGAVISTGRRASWLTRNLLTLSGVSFLQDTASELVYPVLPIFLTVTLGAPAAAVGLVEGVAEGVAAVTKVLSGRLSDRFRRRPLIALGYGLAAVGKAVVAAAAAWPAVLAGRGLDRVGKGVRGAPRDALIAVDVPPAARGRAFGFHRAMDTAGAVLGPLLGIAAYQALGHRIRPLMVVAVVPAIASVLLVAAVREPPGRRRRPAAPAGTTGPAPTVPLRLPARYWRVVALLTAFGLVNFPDALLLLRLHDLGFGVVAVMLAYVTYNLVYAVGSYPAGALADRRRPALVFGVGLLFFAVGYVGLGLTRSPAVAWLVLGLYGMYAAATDGVGKAWVSQLVGAELQGSAQGVFQGLAGGGVLLAGIWAGLAWGADGRVPLLVSGTVGGILGLGLLAWPARRTGPAQGAQWRR